MTAPLTTVTYNGAIQTEGAATKTGFITGDNITVSGLASGKNAGTYTSALTVTGSDIGNYNITISDNNLIINPVALTITANAYNKVYDGTTAATGALTLNGIVSGDTVNVTSNAPLFSNPNVGTGKTVTFDNLSLSGNATTLGNYTLASVGSTVITTANITPAPLTVLVNNSGKFTGKTDPSGYAGVTYSGLVTGETTAVLGSPIINITRTGKGTIESAGTYSSVLVASGPSTIGNYALTYVAGDFTITPPNQIVVQVSSPGAQIYGTALIAPTITSATYMDSSNVIHTLDLQSTVGTGMDTVYTFVESATGDTITFSLTPQNTVLSGSGNIVVGNYALGEASTPLLNGFNGVAADVSVNGNITITKAPASVTQSASTTTYNAAVQTQGSPALSGFIAGDNITVSGQASGTNAGIYGSSLTTSGSDASNYTVTITNANLVITSAPLTITASTNSKIYDGTTNAAATPTVSGLLGSDTVTGLSESYSDKNVGTAKTLSVNSSYILNDGNSGNNYIVTLVNNTTGVITKANASVTGTATTLVYNGNTQTQNSATSAGFISGDSITVSGLASGKNAGTYTSALTVSGNDASNYTITMTEASLVISPATLTLTAVTNSKIYDGTASAAATPAVSGLQGSDTVTGLSESYSDKNVGTGKTLIVNRGSVIHDGNNGNNYTVVTVDNITGVVTQAHATITATPTIRTYNGKVQSQYTPVLSGFISGDQIVVAGLAQGKNVGHYLSALSAGGWMQVTIKLQ